MKKLICFLFVLLVQSEIMAQEENTSDIERLKVELRNTVPDSSKSLIMAQLCEAYRWSFPDSALCYGKKSLALAREIDFPAGEAHALIGLSVINRELGLLSEAVESALKAYRVAASINDPILMSLANVRVANAYNSLRDFSKASIYYIRGLENVKGEKYALESIYYLLSALNYLEGGNLDAAQIQFDKSQKLGDYVKVQYSLLFRVEGKIEEKKGDNLLAIQSYRKAMLSAQRDNNLADLSVTLLDLAGAFKSENMTDSAIIYAEKGLLIAESIKRIRTIQIAYQTLAEIYQESNPKLALTYYEKYSTTKDNLYNVAQVQSFQNAVSNDDEQQAAILRAKADFVKQIRFYLMLIGLLVLVIVFWFFYKNYKRKLKDNLLLSEQKTEIENTLTQLKSTQAQLIQSEKMASLGELTAGIAHEIQNPLNFVNNFSEVSKELAEELKEEANKENIDKDLISEIATDIAENQTKIHHHGNRASSIVKGMLEHSRTSSGKKELTDINALADEYLRLAYHGLRAKDKDFNADFETHFDANLPKIEVITQDIGRVFLNLINNAFQASIERSSDASTEPGRSAVKNQGEKVYKPLVSVATQLITNNQLQITIKDNGPGIPDAIKDKIFQPFFTTKETGKGTGLGLSLAYDIVKAHGGEIELDSETGIGSEFTIQLPLV